MGEVVLTILLAYLFMGFIKFAFGVPAIPTVVWAHRKLLKRMEAPVRSRLSIGAAITLTSAVYAMLVWPYLLYVEKHRFFCVYNKRKILRDVLVGWQEL